MVVRLVALFSLVLVCLLSASGIASASPPSQTGLTTEQWRADLKFLAESLRRHPNPFYKTPEAEFDRAVAELDTALPNLSREDILAGFVRIGSMIDGHTQVPFYQGALNFHMYAVRLYEFSDGLVAVDATPPYQAVVGARLVQIGDTRIEEAYPRVSVYAMNDNASTVKLLTPVFMMIPEVLHAAGLVKDTAVPQFVFEKANGERLTINPQILTTGEYVAQLGRGSFYSGLQKRAEPLMQRDRDKSFWYEALPASNTLYVQYNQVRAVAADGTNLIAMVDHLQKLVEQQDFARIVVDVRHNGGGDNNTYWPLLNFLKDNPKVNVKGKLFLITGRQTFSAAANFSTEVERRTNAIVAGEPMGGSPNLYGDTRTYVLPNSRVQVNVSARTWIKSRPDDPRPSIEPQLPVELSSVEYFAKRDPVMEAIEKYSPRVSSEISPTAQPVLIDAGKGISLTGTLYGNGATAVIFSNMGANHQSDWTRLAEQVAQRGYMALTYDNRYWVNPTKIQDDLRKDVPDDLRAAVRFARAQGAQRIVLIGASLGSMASVKVAAELNPAAVVLMASPIDQMNLPFLVTSNDVRAIAAPKLFVVAEKDEIGFTDDVTKMYEMARTPKQLMVFKGTAHGADVFKSVEGDAVRQRILAFLELYAPVAVEGARTEQDSHDTTMVYVPRGTFVMGSDTVSPRAECEAWSDKTRCGGDWFVPETPTHTVMLDAFWLDQTEVTNAQYAECVAAGKCSAPTKSSSLTRATYYGDAAYANFPVIWTGWQEAKTFCEWRGARLPTEAEWEKAARGEDMRLYPWGNGFAPSPQPRANFCDKQCTAAWANASVDDGFADTSPIGNYATGASAYGALDMAGNVDEWVNDWYVDEYYQFSPRENPKGPGETKQHALRGGSFLSPAFGLRTTARPLAEERGDYIGFRCAAAQIPY